MSFGDRRKRFDSLRPQFEGSRTEMLSSELGATAANAVIVDSG